jgi:tRNA threonylcarbamoyl adenosine modification protein (Sua5/YciO/YrdC/YwlC family)
VRVIGEGDLALAVSALEAGEVVAVPTDTVYGLAVLLSPAGVESVCAMKGRPVDLALPVVVGSIEQASDVAAAWPSSADALARRFWPGALTLVVAAPPALGALVGGPGDSVGLRWPRHGVLNELCAALGPLAVSSANRHGAPPATDVEDVVRFFGADGPAVAVDGGRCDGVPSTVADCTVEPVRRLRDGGVPWGAIEAELSRVGRV